MKKIKVNSILAFILAVIIIQQVFSTVAFGQTKKDTISRSDHLRLNYFILADSYNSIIGDFNKNIDQNKLKCAELVSGDLKKINLILNSEDSISPKEKMWLKKQSLDVAKDLSISISEADQLIENNTETIQKINLFMDDPSDNDAFNAWVKSYKETISLSQKIF